MTPRIHIFETDFVWLCFKLNICFKAGRDFYFNFFFFFPNLLRKKKDDCSFYICKMRIITKLL